MRSYADRFSCLHNQPAWLAKAVRTVRSYFAGNSWNTNNLWPLARSSLSCVNVVSSSYPLVTKSFEFER